MNGKRRSWPSTGLTGCLFAALLGMQTAAAAEAEPTILLHRLDSIEGIRGSWSSDSRNQHIELNLGGRFVSEGAGSVRLVAQSNQQAHHRCYVAMRIPLAKADLTDRSFLLDCWTSTPEATQAVYVRLYGAQGRKVASWCHWNQPFHQSPELHVRLDMGRDRGGFAWEPKQVDAPADTPVEMVEIIMGTQDTDTRFDLYVDNLRMTETRCPSFAKISTLKKLFVPTPLVEAGRPTATIVTPDQPEFLDLARQIQGKIKEVSGADLPVIPAGKVTRSQLAATHGILLGNVACNPAMVEIYAMLYTPVDEAYPKADGYLVHTVHDPWGTGRNVLVLGGSTLPGTKQGVEAFLKTLKPGADLLLPKMNLFSLDAGEMKEASRLAKINTQPEAVQKEIARQVKEAQHQFARGGHRAIASRMGNFGLQYARTGNDLLARLYKELAVIWYESYQAKPAIYGGPWGMDMDFHLTEILPAWDLLEESPALSDAERMQVTRILFEFVTTDVVRKAAGALRSTHVRHNHMTFPALGLFYAGRYFQRGYHCCEAEHWLDIAQACFAVQAKAAKPHEDCNGYGWLVPYHTLRYTLATGDMSYFTNGNVRTQADYAILTMDNLGYQVPYGDTGSFQCWWTEVPFLRGAEFVHRDGRWSWALEKKLAVHPDASRHQYACRVAAKEPVDLLGVRAIPLDKMYWESFDGPKNLSENRQGKPSGREDRARPESPRIDVKTIPLEMAVDKVVMRTSFDPARQYLLLDGLSNGGHMHYDGNSISRITDRGRIWLADNDYIRSLPKFHNGVLVFRDGQADTLPPYCELESMADGASLGLAQTVVRNYTGVDWRRAILWGKERFFLVLDEMVAQEPAAYDFHCLWYVMGNAQLTDEGLKVEQQGPRMHIKSLPTVRRKLTDDAELGVNWKGYAFADPVVRRLREIHSATLAAGERVQLVNLLYTTDTAGPQEFKLTPLPSSSRAVLVSGTSGPIIAGVGEPDRASEILPGLKIAAKAFLLGESTGLLAAATSLSYGDLQLSSSQPVTIELVDGRIELAATQATTVRLAGIATKLSSSGNAARSTIADGGGIQIEIPAGKTTLRGDARVTLAGLGAALANVPTPAAAPTSPAETASKAGQVLWSFQPPAAGEKVLSLSAGNLDGSGDVILAGSDRNRLYCLGPDGKPRWEASAKGPVTTAAIANLDGTKTRTAVAGSEDSHVYAFDPTGKPRWSFELPNYKRPGCVHVLFAADLDGDGREEVIAGGDNWRYYALDRNGRELWHYESVHPSTAGAAADLDGDGRLEILCGTAYYWWHCADSAGAKRWSYSVKMPHATVALSARRDGMKEREAIFGSEDGALHVLDAKGKLLWRANVGDDVTSAVAVDLAGDSRDQIIAGSASANVVAFDAAGKRLWRKSLDDGVRALLVGDLYGNGQPRIVAGCDDGRLVILSTAGEFCEAVSLPGPVVGLAWAKLPQGPAVIARTQAGPIVAVSFASGSKAPAIQH